MCLKQILYEKREEMEVTQSYVINGCSVVLFRVIGELSYFTRHYHCSILYVVKDKKVVAEIELGMSQGCGTIEDIIDPNAPKGSKGMTQTENPEDNWDLVEDFKAEVDWNLKKGEPRSPKDNLGWALLKEDPAPWEVED